MGQGLWLNNYHMMFFLHSDCIHLSFIFSHYVFKRWKSRISFVNLLYRGL